MKKRAVSIMLAVAILIGMLPMCLFSASAETYSGTCGANVRWSLDTDTGVLNIYGSGPMTNYTYNDSAPWISKYASIKTAIIEDGVTSIGDRAFYLCSYVTNVTIPNSVTCIGDYAFYNCARLTSIAIPSSVTSIGFYAFYSCWALTDITIPDSVTSIGACAFYFCDNLTSITLPNSVTSIENGMFRDCKSLKSITLSDSLNSIGNYAFYNCPSLTSITIPNSVTSIGNYAFAGCTALTDITLPDSVTAIGDYAFYYCWGLTDITIPDSVNEIGNSVFRYCDNLKSVTLSASLSRIGNYAFSSTKDELTAIYFKGNAPALGENAFSVEKNGTYSQRKGLTVYYIEGKTGWTSPTWNGYPTATWTPVHKCQYAATVTAPTCTAEGYTTYICACGDSYVSDYVAALGHSYAYANNGNNHTVRCTNDCGFSSTEGHNFIDGSCICGGIAISEPIMDSDLIFGAQLYLENDLTMAFRVKSSKLEDYDLSTAYLVVEREVYESGAKEATILTTTISDYTISGDGRLVFSYPGIAAAQMNDSIRATLCVKNANGQMYFSPAVNTSVATYLDGLLGAYANDSKMLTLIMDMVNYGAAAQVYFDRHADAPVNEAFESFKTYASYASADFTTVLEDLSGTTTNEDATGKLSQGLDLGTRIGIQYKVTLPEGVNAEDAQLVITDAKGNTLETIEVSTGTVDSKGRYVVNFYGSTSKDMRRVVYATAYANGMAITGTYAYSISTYAWGIQENAAQVGDPALVSLTRAMMLYGDSAAAYFG